MRIPMKHTAFSIKCLSHHEFNNLNQIVRSIFYVTICIYFSGIWHILALHLKHKNSALCGCKEQVLREFSARSNFLKIFQPKMKFFDFFFNFQLLSLYGRIKMVHLGNLWPPPIDRAENYMGLVIQRIRLKQMYRFSRERVEYSTFNIFQLNEFFH